MEKMRPGADEYVGHYVKAIHDFHSGLQGEISLKVGDVFKVTRAIDNNWLCGRSGKLEGNFPRDFVEKLHLPLTSGPEQKVFAAVENFPAQQDGDLQLKKGDVILGLHPIDEFWWRGEIDSRAGIFPVTHVMELELSTLLRSRSKSVHSAEPLFAQALVDAVPQLDEELGFVTGDLITVTEVVDEDWYIGECHGKSGMFLAACVRLLNEEECSSSPSKEHKSHSFVKPKETNQSSSNASHQRVPSTSVQSDQTAVSHEEKQIAEDSNRDRSLSYTSENTKAHNDSDAGVTPYARTLFTFVGENPDELNFTENDIVTLIQHVDEQWIEGELDGKIGLFPANYVEIVVDCPYAYLSDDSEHLQPNTDNNANLEFHGETFEASTSETTPHAKEELKQEHDQKLDSDENLEDRFGLVLFTFNAETERDLTVHEGETVSVIKWIDDNWLFVRNDINEEGMCPCGYVEIIGSSPEPTHKIHDSNDNEIRDGKPVILHEPTQDTGTGNSCSRVERKNENDSLSNSKSAIKPTEVYSSAVISPDKGNTSDKVRSKVKPALAPKPKLKPKPLLSPKPTTKPEPVSPMTSDGCRQLQLPKSSSSRSLSVYGTELGDQTESMTKAQSMVDVNKTDLEENLNDCLRKTDGNKSGSLCSLDDDRRNSSEQKKVFEDWDMTKPLDSLLQNEFLKAKVEADNRSRSGSNRSSGSLEHSGKSWGAESDTRSEASVSSVKKPNVPPHPKSSFTPNYSRVNFETKEDEFSVGNSTFFLGSPNDKMKRPNQQKPPRPASSYSFRDTDDTFARRPSLKKAAPPRPSGPRLAPLPSKTPMVPSIPSRTVPSKMVPSRPAPAQPVREPARAVQTPTGEQRRYNRPAPPRPQMQAKRTPAVTKPKDDNLMAFSPSNSSVDVAVEDDTDSEIVTELKSRIAAMEAEIETFQKSKAELEQMQENIDDGTSEIHDNVQFYDDNIQGLSQELATLKENLASLSPQEKSKIDEEKAVALRRQEMRRKLEEEKKERRTKRMKVMDELIQTEKDFINSLSLIMETFLGPTVDKNPDVDIELLFGNIEEVADVSQRLLTKLEEATCGKDFSQQVIGTCFVCLAEDMKNVYAPYCRNHDDVISLIEKYSQNSETKAYLDELLDKLREKHVVFDLEALLIKPVQRILKYPLLLNALTKATEDDHADKKEILRAITAMTDVATAINEYKRRKDLVYKYKKDTEASLGDKLSKLSLHSLKKKSSRIRERFSANLGFIDQTRDPSFDREETQYRHLEKLVKVFVRDVQVYMEELQAQVSTQEGLAADIEDFHAEKSDTTEIQKYQSFSGKIHMTFFPNFQMELDDLVMFPLGQLSQLFEGPNKVIQKRYDKLLDYDNMKRKAQSDKSLEKALQMAQQTYEALNAQLLDELPKLYKLAFQLLRDCVGSFVRAQREFNDHILQEMYTLMDLQMIHEEGVIEMFNIKHTAIVDRLALLSFMPRNFSPRMADQKQEKKNKRMSMDPGILRKSTEAVPQIDSQRVFVTQRYPASKLYRVTETHISSDSMDISLCEGDIVGIIMEKDPMGNKDRWFVDNGASKGFLPKKLLASYETSSPPRIVVGTNEEHQQPSAASTHLIGQNAVFVSGGQPVMSTTPVLPSMSTVEDDMDFALDEDMTPEVGGADNPVYGAYNTADEELELYYALYAFTARTDNEVTLFEHQVVTVQAQHDQNGNPEWWYVDADGSHGYAPAAYLRKMDTHGDPT